MLPARILIVDDEPQIRGLLVTLLLRQGYEITEACDGVEALALCEGGLSFDLPITDVAMPRMDGVQLAERVCSLLPAVRILYMSGRCEMEEVRQHLRGGQSDFIRKPFQIGSLVATIQELVGPGKARRGSPQAARKRPCGIPAKEDNRE